VPAFSQDYSYINYDTRDGLAGSLVYDAIQDKEGFMWFATENGLSRFDGKDFKTFTTKDGLPDNEVLKLFVDSKGRVWIMPFRPSLCYYFKGKIYNSTNDTLLAKISLRTYAFDMTEDRWGNLYIAEETRWHAIFKNNIVRTNDKINNSDFPNFAVNALGVNKNKEVELLLFTNFNNKHHYSIYSNNKNVEIFKTLPERDEPDIAKSLITPDFVIIPNQHGRLSFFSDSSKSFQAELPSNTVSINNLENKKIVINTRTGIRFYDLQTKILSPPIFSAFSFTSAFEDKEHNLWLTTTGSGVLMVPSFQFINFSISQAVEKPEISALTINGNVIYAGGWGNKIWTSNMDSLKFSSQRLTVEKSKIISIILVNNKLLGFDWKYFRNPFNPRQPTYACALKSAYVGKSGILFASHIKAFLCKWTGEEQLIWNGRTTCVVESDSGFYIGTLNGLYYKSLNGQIVDLRNICSAFSSRIVNLVFSNNGILWVTTKGSGIAGYSHNKLLYHFTQSDGLTSDNCTSLYVDGNIVWVGTDKGLNRIQITNAQSKITHFSMSDGLPTDNISAIAASGNKVFVGTPKGLTYFEVDKISQTSTCDLELTGIYVANKYWCYDSTNFSLPHKSNDIRFEFSGISFKSAGEMIYKYRVLGLQPEWRTTTEKQLSFPTLSSGAYTLQLKVINKYGVESKTKEVLFTIEKLLWEKTWFKIFIATLFASVIWLLVAYRIKKIRQKEKDKADISNRIAELEQKALRSQMNPHFIFNCLNSIQQYVAERDITGANNFITDFARLIRMTLDLSTHPFISLYEEVEYISTYLRVEKARLEDAFDYRLNIDEALNLHSVYLPPLLLQPYLENSIRHGIRYRTERDGLIQININKKNDGVLIQIEDNGIGRRASKKYKSEYHIQYQSRGMTINEDRIKVLNDSAEKRIELLVTDLYNSNEEAAGTRVDVYLPS
jgi:ligand-binding sensor domain-containing protein